MHALVLGGYGAVGAPTTAALRERGHTVSTAGRDPRRADRPCDLSESGLRGYRDALDGVDVVVNASGAEDPALVSAATDQGRAFVDATATTDYVRAVEGLLPRSPVLLSVGLAPGLTNLLAAAVHADAPGEDPLDLAVLLGAGEEHGAAATAWSLGLLGRSFRDPATGAPVRNLTQGRAVDLPGLGRRRLYRADFSDQHALTRDLGRPVRTRFGLDSRTLTTGLALLTHVPGASRMPTGVHALGTDAWIVLAHCGGLRRWARGRGQSRATAHITAWAAGLTEGLSPGVHHLHEVARLDDLPAELPLTMGAAARTD
ncbi:saccharopine dehydrogenase family protein [Nocardiopsis aegyptia]|uniref:Saccharopine dehydrogenase-like NADP-dependent oxidoreductase n=1 Tax=Nocardiopsis aegyptia TaxID=220378 RepID=A0A7Z0EVT2_9ACTN|nr:saccharopine dehydrogenase [Nocardiopsis aegyptia]NYJ38230.1 saccharopine dehydrogenase-like NADP-dependent oxidoreductase [Nocardiopsis aegyptia]